jgi:O-antigen ligase
MAPRGLHANEFGLLLALACGPLLFVAAGTARPRWRLGAAVALAVVFCGVLLTFSRGALLACAVTLGGFLWHQRRIKTLVGVVVAVLLFALAAPQALQDRLGTGVRAGAIGDATDVQRDELTAGRVHGWVLLAPEVLESPWIGRGLGSSQWSAAVAAGRYRADHPHNIYLELLMDLGLLGFAAVAACYAFFLRRLRALADEPALGPELRSFFLGARWALWGALAMAVTTAYYMPNPAQTYLWFALGMAFAFAPAAVPARVGVTDARRAAAAGAGP